MINHYFDILPDARNTFESLKNRPSCNWGGLKIKSHIEPLNGLKDVAPTPDAELTIIKPELTDSTAQPLRDLREIQVPVEALAAGDVIALPSPPVPFAPIVRWHIHSITPYVKNQPRQAVVVKFMGKVTPDGTKWALSGSECVPFETVTTMRYWTVCGGAKLDAARKDASKVVKVATMQRWIGEKVA